MPERTGTRREALPGVATPFTWSVAGDYSESGFRRAFATLGCTVPKNARLVGNVHGRFYLNLSEFMRIAAQVPWLDPRTLAALDAAIESTRMGQAQAICTAPWTKHLFDLLKMPAIGHTERLAAAFAQLGLSPQVRAEAVPLQQFVALTKLLAAL
ncbi:MAG: hypothetical protein HC841_07680 [Verrucomicrobiae bacterium]|nr:hypothetical protein [Verrucomicrobiae bacterium]